MTSKPLEQWEALEHDDRVLLLADFWARRDSRTKQQRLADQAVGK